VNVVSPGIGEYAVFDAAYDVFERSAAPWSPDAGHAAVARRGGQATTRACRPSSPWASVAVELPEGEPGEVVLPHVPEHVPEVKLDLVANAYSSRT
jgi:hypothetical protein